MVAKAIQDSVKQYLKAARENGIRASKAVLYGSQARGTAHVDSDIDLVVVAPEFDGQYTRELYEKLWLLRLKSDHRIEPVPCGEKEWEAPLTARTIIEVAHREGIEIPA